MYVDYEQICVVSCVWCVRGVCSSGFMEVRALWRSGSVEGDVVKSKGRELNEHIGHAVFWKST